jgi:hypothetical protein
MQFPEQVPILCCIAEPGSGCPMQTPSGITKELITFLEYRQLQDQFIGHTCHIERTKKDLRVEQPTLRQLEEHFISYEMSFFELCFRPYLPQQKIDYAAYLTGEIEDMKSDTNRHFTWAKLGCQPTEEELALNYIASQAHENYRARFWHLVKD